MHGCSHRCEDEDRTSEGQYHDGPAREHYLTAEGTAGRVEEVEDQVDYCKVPLIRLCLVRALRKIKASLNESTRKDDESDSEHPHQGEQHGLRGGEVRPELSDELGERDLCLLHLRVLFRIQQHVLVFGRHFSGFLRLALLLIV